jgi:hypothetical protein
VRHFAVFDEHGKPVAFYNTDLYPDVVKYGPGPKLPSGEPGPVVEISRATNPSIPAGALEVSDADWREMVDNQGLRRWNGKTLDVVEPGPMPEPVTVVFKVDFYRRLTDEECDKVEAEVAKQSSKQRGIFASAASFRSDAPEWATLEGLTKSLFGDERASEILAPSTG